MWQFGREIGGERFCPRGLIAGIVRVGKIAHDPS
jgi:hypothetical protein